MALATKYTPSPVPTYEDGCCVEALVHVLVEKVGNPGEEGEGGDVTQGGGDRGRHVVRVHLQHPASKLTCLLQKINGIFISYMRY